MSESKKVPERIVFRVSEKEYRQMRAAAQDASLSLSSWLRWVGMRESKPYAAKEAEKSN